MSGEDIGPREGGASAARSVLTVYNVMPLFAATLFLSAMLLFCVQPLFVKMMLPLLGGSPGVWNTAMVFFQTALLAGYTYAHLMTRLFNPRQQVLLHLLLLAVAVVVLPIAIPHGWSPPAGHSPIPWLIGLLAVSIGLPFFVVSASAPLLQRWFSASGHRMAHDPYFLYGASNLGSILALIGYPCVIEPLLPLAVQSRLWSWGYALLAALIAACGMALWSFSSRPQAHTDAPPADRPAIGWADRGAWIALSAIPSSLLLGVTSQITTDVVSAPLLWVLPLAIYLLSFTIVFARRPVLPHGWMVRALPYAIIPIALCYATPMPPVWLGLPLHLSALFVAAMICHGELARRRPVAARLTDFYLCMSFGGMLGGLFAAIFAPLIFNGIYEYPIALVLACLAAPRAERSAAVNGRDFLLPAALLAVMAIPILGEAALWRSFGGWGLAFFAALGGLVTFSFRTRPVRFALGVAILVVASISSNALGPTLHKERSFFGVHKVQLLQGGRIIALLHGTTIHGEEFVDPAHWRDTIAYYHPAGPVGQFFAALDGKKPIDRVGVIGLGTGGLNCFRRPPQSWTYFEIDPTVLRLARDSGYFHFLAECGADTGIVLGDARLSLNKLPDRSFDLLILDAFSSDAIPIHLLTREALGLYLAKLRDGGVVLFHISNRYLDLAPVVANLVGDAGAVARHQLYSVMRDTPDADDQASSEWVAIARKADDLAFLDGNPRWQTLRPQPGGRVWTDDYSNLVGALKLK